MGVNTDAYIRRVKGHEPMVNELQRMEAIRQLGIAEKVVLMHENDPVALLARERPHLHCTGEEYGRKCKEAKHCEREGIRLILVPRILGFSTTALRKEKS